MRTSALHVGDARMITALFNDRNSAERAYRVAGELGYDKADITVLISEETRKRHFPGEVPSSELGKKASAAPSKTPEGADLGGPVSGTAGTLAPAAAAVGTVLLIPGIIFVGPVAVALTAAAAVGLAGGLVGVRPSGASRPSVFRNMKWVSAKAALSSASRRAMRKTPVASRKPGAWQAGS